MTTMERQQGCCEAFLEDIKEGTRSWWNREAQSHWDESSGSTSMF